MNKQYKIKKVMHEFKDGKLKTPICEVVTDKNQALALFLTKLSQEMDNPQIYMLMKSIIGDASVKERMTNKAI